MEKIATIKQLIDLWPARKDLAKDVGVETDRVHGWAKAGSIPAKFHMLVCESANRRSYPVSAELLDRLHCEGSAEEAA